MSAAQILDWVQRGGVIALLLLVIISGWKGIWVWGKQLDECEKRGDEWKQMALGNLNLASRAAQTAQSTVDVRTEILQVLRSTLEQATDKPPPKRKRPR